MAPRARSTPAVSTAMVSALDALPSVLVTEHPRREARGLDRVVGTERRPVDVAPRISGPAPPPLGLGDHLAGALDPHPDLRGTEVHPAARRRVPRVAPSSAATMSRPVGRPSSSSATYSATSSGVMNSIWPSAVTVSNSSEEKRPFSPTSMYTPSSGLPRSHHGVVPGRNASPTGTGSGQSTSGIGFPLRRIGP